MLLNHSKHVVTICTTHFNNNYLSILAHIVYRGFVTLSKLTAINSRSSINCQVTQGRGNLQLAGSMFLATQCYVAREDISNEKKPFNALRRKAEIERLSSFGNL